MAKLIITADIHGSLSAWSTIKGLLGPSDTLAVAGDLFDTVYGSSSDIDYQPDTIRREFLSLACETHYVYGNCDKKEFLAGFETFDTFIFEGRSILLNHGHKNLPDLTEYHIVIQGHSHIPQLETLMGKVFLNPGSPSLPRVSFASYAVIEDDTIKIMEFPDHTVLKEMNLKDVITRELF